MVRNLPALLAALLLLATPLAAQTLPGIPQGGDAAATEEAPAPGSEDLIRLLRDDAAREELIRQLEAGAATASGEPDSGTAAPAEEPGPLSVGQRVAGTLQDAADIAAVRAVSLYSQLKRTPTRLAQAIKAADPEFLTSLLRELAFMVIVTYAVFFTIRGVAREVSRRLASAAVARRFLPKLGIAVVSSLLDAAVVGIAVLIALIAAVFLLGYGENLSLSLAESAYLTAFAVVELTKVVFRFFLAPRIPSLRLVSLGNGPVGRLWSWLSVSISILGYGLLLIVPVVEDRVGFLAGFALNTVIGVAVILFTLAKVVANRGEVAGWLGGEHPETQSRLGPFLTRNWHWPAILYLLGLLLIVLIRPGNVLLPLLAATGQILAFLLGWIFLRNRANRLARRGVRLSEATKEMFPALERRLNSMLPKLVILFRGLLAFAVLVAMLAVLGIFRFDQAVGPDGLNVTNEILTIVFIVGLAIGLWLAIASWVDFRLNPSGRRTPSSRETTLLTLLYNAATIAIIIFAAMFILSELGINIGPLIASAGVLGLAIGFGSQKLVQDIITGIFIQFENAINVGDVVTVGGITGAVEKLTIRSVSLRDVEGAFHIIPFSSVDVVTNYMREFSYFVCDMGVAYREKTGEVKQAMLDAFDLLRQDEEHAPNILGDLEWFGVQAFGDNAVVLRARIKTLPGKQWATGRAYNGIIKDIFDERGIEIPFPHQTIYFGVDRDGHAPPLRVAREDAESVS